MSAATGNCTHEYSHGCIFFGGGGPNITPPEYLICIILNWKNLCLLVSGILTQVTVWDINNA